MKRTIQAAESASVYMLAVCVGSVFSLFLSLALSRVSAGFDGMSVYSWVAYALMQVAFIGTVLVFGRLRKWDFKQVLRLKKPLNWWQLALTPLIAIAAVLAFLPLANLWSAFLNVIGYRGAGASMPYYSNAGVYILSLLLMAALPAVGEELLMRGGVFSGLSTKNVWFGVLISALLFSLMHANPLQTVHQFGLGVVLALTVALTGSVFAACLVHFFNNFISITVTAYLPEVDVWYVRLGAYNWLTGAASTLLGIFLLIVLFYALYRLGEDKRSSKVVGRIDYDSFSIYSIDESKKSDPCIDFFKFFASLFTKSGLKRVTSELTRRNGVQLVNSKAFLESMGQDIPAGKLLLGVWIAIGLMGVYWLYAFIVGLV